METSELYTVFPVFMVVDVSASMAGDPIEAVPGQFAGEGPAVDASRAAAFAASVSGDVFPAPSNALE